MKTVAKLFLLLVSASLAWGADPVAQNRGDDIREVVFRWHFDRNGSDNRPVNFIAIGSKGEDPSDEFMKRFADYKRSVRKASERVVSGDGKSKGPLYSISSIAWKSDSEVEVKGAYYNGPRAAAGYTYVLTKEGDKWKVTKIKRDWIA